MEQGLSMTQIYYLSMISSDEERKKIELYLIKHPETTEVAEMLDQIDKFFWRIGRIAVRIPSEMGMRTDLLKNFKMSPLQQFAIDVQKQTNRYKDWKDLVTLYSLEVSQDYLLIYSLLRLVCMIG